jgi:hypothetical protein
VPDDAIVWPVGTSGQDPDLADRPFVFAPKGFLVAIVDGADEAEQAAAALRAVGFDRQLRTFTPRQILDDHERYVAQKSLARRLVTAVSDDPETLNLYHGHARDGRYAVWVHVVDDEAANRAIRGLADVDTLHIRHYGHRGQSDFSMRSPTS